MGKIKVESCEIEGLKVITPTVYIRNDEADNRTGYKPSDRVQFLGI